ncbi:MAG: glycosyltransferase family 8 protein [Candidatus Pacearchaeota archaeon]
MKKEFINVGSLADNNYAQHLGVTIYSMLKNCSDPSRIKLFIIDGGFSEINRKKLDTVAQEFGLKINYIKPDVRMLKGVKVQEKFTIATYYKFCLLESVKTDKLLYLDSDLVVDRDINEIYHMNLGRNIALAVEDEDISTKHKVQLGLKGDQSYFNAGVLMINMRKWREAKINYKAIKFIRENPEKVEFSDQDGLNFALRGEWGMVNSSWNSLAKRYYFRSKPKDKRLIIHYAGFLKPWNTIDIVPFKSRYGYYASLTPWSDTRYIDKNFSKVLKRIKDCFLFTIKMILKN